MADDRRWLRYAAAAGIASVVLTVVSAFLPGAPPAPDDPLPDIKAYYADHRTALLLAAYLGGLGVALSLWFIAALRGVLRRAEGGEGTLALAMFAGGLVVNALALLGAIVTATLAFNANRDDGTLRLAVDLGNMVFALLYFPWALFTAAASAVMLRTAVFPRPLGWAGLVVSVVMLVSAAGLGQTSGALAAGGVVSFLAFLLGMAWIVVTAVLLLRVQPAAQPTARMAPV
jgi:hypothetical protein